MTSCGARRQSLRGKRWVDAYCKLLLRRLCCDDSSAPPSPCELVLKSALSSSSAAEAAAAVAGVDNAPMVLTVMKHVAEDIVRGQPHRPEDFPAACTSCANPNTTAESTSANRIPCTDHYEQNTASELLKHRVFVYGTLKFGQPNHYHFDSWKKSGKCRFVGKARSIVPFPLIVATRWNLPFLLYEPGKGKIIHGEVYDVDDELLAWMDWFEGHPAVYQRDSIAVTLIDQSRTTQNSAVSQALLVSSVPDDKRTAADASAVVNNHTEMEQPKNASLNSGQISEEKKQTDEQDKSATCWVYYLKKYDPVLSGKESYVSFDAFGAPGKQYRPDDGLKEPKDIVDGLNNETLDNNNGAAVVNSKSADIYSNSYEHITGIQDVADDLAREVDNILKQ